jgi:RNA polymerase sigma-70 factor (ECF subfamily)
VWGNSQWVILFLDFTSTRTHPHSLLMSDPAQNFEDPDFSDADFKDSASQVNRMRDLAMYWVNSQSVISAYISANVVDAHHVEDILQEVAQVCAEKFSEYDRERSFISWAMGIARNRILKYYRSRSRDRMVLSEAVLERLEGALEKMEPEAEDRREALRECIKRVEGRRRNVLDLRYRENVRVNEIADRFGMPSSAVSVMLHRIRTDLLDCVRHRLKIQGTLP